MPVETVRAEWVRDNVFVLYDRFGFPVVMTQPMGVNGADLMPLSVIGCAAWDVMSIVRKQREPVSGLRVVAESERDAEAPWLFRRLRVHYQFTGTGLNPERLQRAITLSESKYCSTFGTLQQAVEISSEFTIAPPAGPDPGTLQPAKAGDEAVRVVLDFNAALNAGDVDAMMRLMTADCVFENTFPAPDGTRLVGQAAVRAFWESFFASSQAPRLEVEEAFGLGERCVLRWTYRWREADGRPGHVRGVDVYRLRAGLIHEKLSYVKG